MFNISFLYWLVLAYFICFSCAANVPTESIEMSNISRSKKTTIHDILAVSEDVAHEIFEYLLNEDYDYTVIRKISKSFRKFHDECIHRMSRKYFPFYIRAALHLWDNEVVPANANDLKYKLNPLFKFFLGTNGNPNRMLASIPDPEFKQKAVLFINHLKSSDLNQCLKLKNMFLKLEIVAWGDVVQLLFWEKPEVVLRAWTLGLTTIAREMSTYHLNMFLESVGPRGEGLLEAIKAKKYALSSFMIHFLLSRSYQFHKAENSYLARIINNIILANYWDLLEIMYESNKKYIQSSNYALIANYGYIEGLRILRDSVEKRAFEMSYNAASKGHLAFLQELDHMGLLKESCYQAIHSAAAYGQTDCLEFLVRRLGTKYLSVADGMGALPIHYAAGSRNPETLLAILWHYPDYEPKNSLDSRSKVNSPLLTAVKSGSIDVVRILLQHFPESIYLKDHVGNTIIHLAMDSADHRMLRFLLSAAPPQIIAADNADGQTALHFGLRYKIFKLYLKKLRLLMGTGLFTGWERNIHDRTPIGELWKRRGAIIGSNRSKLKQIFNINTEAELNAAIRTDTDYRHYRY